MTKPFRRDVAVLGAIVICGSMGLPGRLAARPVPDPPLVPAAKLDRHGDPLPPGAVLRLGTVKYRQDSRIDRIAYTTDGKHFVTDGEDSVLRVWDASAGRVVRRIDPGVGVLEDFGLPSTGKFVMAIGTTREAGKGYVQNVALVDLETGRPEERGSWPADDARRVSLAICPDRRLVALGTDRRGVRVLDARNGTEVCRLDPGDREVGRIEFSRDGRRLAVETEGSGLLSPEKQLILFDLGQKRAIRSIRPGTIFLEDFAFSPDGRRVATTIDGGLGVWDVESGERTTYGSGSFEYLAFSADGRMLAGVSQSGTIGLYDLGKRTTIASFGTGVTHERQVALSPDGRTLLGIGGKGVLRCWDLRSRRDRFAIAVAHVEPVDVLLFTPDGRTAITGSRDATMRLWDLGSGKPSRVLRLLGPMGAAAISPGGRRLAAATFMNHQVFAWDLREGGGPVVMAYAYGSDIVSPARCHNLLNGREATRWQLPLRQKHSFQRYVH